MDVGRTYEQKERQEDSSVDVRTVLRKGGDQRGQGEISEDKGTAELRTAVRTGRQQ